ncbi:hypothetical protein AB0I39_16890 [Kitasatospora purpeofusca]|uniref:hypothetical protein n=1 Tax=Kitasatospora purpeofusca TaxID=67352 RepID=UPI00340DB2EA
MNPDELNSERIRIAGRVAAITRFHGPDDPRLPALREKARALVAEERITAIIADAPPLTETQRERLALLLNPKPLAAVPYVPPKR